MAVAAMEAVAVIVTMASVMCGMARARAMAFVVAMVLLFERTMVVVRV